MKKILFSTTLSLALLSACSTPQIITLKDGTTVLTVDEVDYNRSSGFYEFIGEDGRRSQLNKDEVKEIKDVSK